MYSVTVMVLRFASQKEIPVVCCCYCCYFSNFWQTRSQSVCGTTVHHLLFPRNMMKSAVRAFQCYFENVSRVNGEVLEATSYLESDCVL